MLTTLTTLTCDSCGLTETSPTELGWLVRDRLNKEGWLTLWVDSLGARVDYCPECARPRGLVAKRKRP